MSRKLIAMVDFECSSSKPNYKDWDFKAAAKGFIGSSDFSSSSSSSVLEDELVSSESADTTDEEDDYIAELTRQMTHYMLQDDHDKANISSQKNQELLGSVGWPQYSTLWSPLGSSYGSPEGPSLEPTPPATPVKNHAWNSCTYADVLKKLDKLDITNQGLNSPQGASTCTEVAENSGVRSCSKQGLTFDQSQDFQKLEAYHRVKQKKISSKQGSSSRGRQANIGNQQFEPTNYKHQHKGGACGRSRSPTQFGLPAASNPWMSQQASPGMRAVFLGGSGSKTRSSCGTGCSPVLIPAKVVQALKVHFDRVGELPRPNVTGFSIQNDGFNKGDRASKQSTKKRHSRGVPEMNHNEMGLPQEWTY
ncbi:hypothetical protein Prudu_015934 [Prunus dulcis]|uniref:Uncharacterized protein n=1 Tax=Prunus dulcis TaxID=3755 RepID=A0A4Y1RM31_PRUDU|nr:hypothetical protein Prudu_015934 [Prunus dulcis]